MFELLEYLDAAGGNPFREWLKSLDSTARSKVTAALDRLSAGNMSEIKTVGSGVLERRIHSGPGYRVYFGRDGARFVILLAGGTKHGQRRDIAAATLRWADYKRRKA